jgi:hypothetical protein
MLALRVEDSMLGYGVLHDALCKESYALQDPHRGLLVHSIFIGFPLSLTFRQEPLKV